MSRASRQKAEIASIAAKHRTVSDFRKCDLTAYNYAWRKGWLDEITSGMVRTRRPNGYWTKEKCGDEAARFRHRKDFQLGAPSACATAQKNGWMDDICGHMTPKASRLVRHVYEIADHKRQVVYVGLTYDIASRARAHKSSARMQRAFPNGVELHALRANLTEAEAQDAEDYFISMYAFMGYTLVNRQRAGNLGGMRKIYTLERCKAEALKHRTKKGFRTAEGYAYAMASRSGWLDEICAHMTEMKKPNGYWTAERIFAEADRCENFTEFVRNGRVYQAANARGLIDEVRARLPAKRKPRGYWTLERLVETALRYDSAREFSRAEASAYTTARYRGWLSHIEASFESNAGVVAGEAPVQQ